MVINNLIEYINQKAMDDPNALVREAEDRFASIISDTAKQIYESGYKIVMLAGPSSAGKTTTAKMIAQGIGALGAKAYTVSLDDFYLGAESSPRCADGSPNFETVYALDLPLIASTFNRLVCEGESDLPIFDFTHGRRSDDVTHISLSEHDVIIVEGLHALNPVITELLPQDGLFKIYISLSSRIYDAEGNVILSKRNIRFLRRTVRDFRFRASSVENTYSLWPSVTKGEDEYLFPFEDRNDIKINSIHVYEPCILANEATELLREVAQDSPYYENAQMLINNLAKFTKLSESIIPENSLLREFFGA